MVRADGIENGIFNDRITDAAELRPRGILLNNGLGSGFLLDDDRRNHRKCDKKRCNHQQRDTVLRRMHLFIAIGPKNKITPLPDFPEIRKI